MIPTSLPPDHPVYEVSIGDLDSLWEKTALETYIKENGGDSNKRLALACSLGVNNYIPLEMPEIRVDGPNQVCFIDGRHRFSRIRDMNKEKVLVVVSPYILAFKMP